MTDAPTHLDERYILDRWEHAGLPCVLARGHLGIYLGYVRTEYSGEIDAAGLGVHVYGGLTYGVDDDGWVGFDFAHPHAVCVIEDEDGDTSLLPSDSGYPNLSAMEQRVADRSGLDVRRWSAEDARDEVEHLAEQLDALVIFDDS